MSARWTIATWNVNSLRVRYDQLVEWMTAVSPDVVCLQETKVPDAEFPAEEFARRGYEVCFAGQKAYNGVAILARAPLTDIQIGHESGFAADEQRLISARVAGVHVFCVYVPNGKSVDNPDFPHKIRWLEELTATVRARTAGDPRVVVCGDFNVAPQDRDVHDPAGHRGHLLCHPAERAAFSALLELGLHDAFRLRETSPGFFSWWDYRAGSFRRNLGLRIDHLLVSPGLADLCRHVSIERAERAKPRPSDHAPVLASFELPA
jgi:exodeoxyribonuclease III